MRATARSGRRGRKRNVGLLSRLARARQLGFNVERRLYHGTKRSDIEAFSNRMLGTNTRAPSAAQAHFFTDDPRVASAYTERLALTLPDAREIRPWAEANAPELLPDLALWESGRLKGKKLWDLEDRLREAYKNGQNPNVIPVYARDGNMLEHDFGSGGRDISFDDLLQQARAEGRRGAVFRNVYDLGRNRDGSRIYSNVYALFDPADVRSVFAKFDPARAGEANLLAGTAGATVLGGGLLSRARRADARP